MGGFFDVAEHVFYSPQSLLLSLTFAAMLHGAATAGDLDRIQQTLGLSRAEAEQITMGLHGTGDIQIEGDALKLSPQLCVRAAKP